MGEYLAGMLIRGGMRSLDEAGAGPEPSYQFINSGFQLYEHETPFQCELTDNPNGGLLPSFKLAYETWGDLNADKSNAVLLFTGLSASSHAKSHEGNETAGWWEKFIGPGKALDTNSNFVVCVNVLGGCYGSSNHAHTCKASGRTSVHNKVRDALAERFSYTAGQKHDGTAPKYAATITSIPRATTADLTLPPP